MVKQTEEEMVMSINWKDAPEGATHYGKRYKGYSEKWYKLDGDRWFLYSLEEGRWLGVRNYGEGGFENLTPRPVDEWKPEVGEKCEVKESRSLSTFPEWTVCTFLHLNIDPLGRKQFVILDPDGNVAILCEEDDIIFRPIKTEADVMFDIVKDAVDLYQACELLVEAGYSK